MEGFKVREQDNMSKPRGKYELEKLINEFEELEKIKNEMHVGNKNF